MAANGKVSSMSPLLKLSSEVWFNIITMKADGKNENYRLNYDDLQQQMLLQADSAYDLAVKAGYSGTVNQWLESLKGRSAYQIAVDSGQFTGTQEAWLLALNALFNVGVGVKGQVLVADVDRTIWKELTKDMVGLDQVDNTPDMEKPISVLMQEALDAKASKAEIPQRVLDALFALGMYLDDAGDLVIDEGNLNRGVSI